MEQNNTFIWIITEDTSSDTRVRDGNTDTGGILFPQSQENHALHRTAVSLEKLQTEMKIFLSAVESLFEQANAPKSNIDLEEVEISAAISKEGQISLWGIGGKLASNGGIKLKFRRRVN